MLPALAPKSYELVNGRTLSIHFDIADGVAFSAMINPVGDVFYKHVYFRSGNGRWETLS